MEAVAQREAFAGGHLVLEKRDWLATILFDRAAKRNAFSLAMWCGLPEILTCIEADESIRVVIVRGAGGNFCAGADIGEFPEIYADKSSADSANAMIREAQRRLRALARPTIALVEGACVGGGCGLALACDLRFASVDARFGIPPSRLGLIYSFQDTMQLVEKVGVASAKDMLFSARLLDADEALRVRLIDRLSSPKTLEAETLAYATALANLSQGSIRAAKAMVNAAADQIGDNLAGRFADLVASAFDSPDFGEGRDAFLARRSPQFKVKL